VSTGGSVIASAVVDGGAVVGGLVVVLGGVTIGAGDEVDALSSSPLQAANAMSETRPTMSKRR